MTNGEENTNSPANRPRFWRDSFDFSDRSQVQAVRKQANNAELTDAQCLDFLRNSPLSNEKRAIERFQQVDREKCFGFSIFGFPGAYFIETMDSTRLGVWSRLNDVRDYIYCVVGYLDKVRDTALDKDPSARSTLNREGVSLTLEQIDAIRKSSVQEFRPTLLEYLRDRTLLTVDIKTINDEQYVELYDSCLDALLNCEINVATYVYTPEPGEEFDYDSFSPYIYILGIPGAYWVNGVEGDHRGVWSTLDEARRFLALWFNRYEQE